MLLWLVGRVHDHTWDFQGVFDSEEKAVAACIDGSYFVGPVQLNETLPRETTPFLNAYYPAIGRD